MSRSFGCLVLALLGATGARAAQSPVQSDNQYDVPRPGPTDLEAQISPAEDGRFELDVRGAFGKGIKFSPPGDLFAVQVRGRVQLRSSGVFDAPAVDELDRVDPRIELAVRRARIVVGGHFLAHQLSYYLQLGVGPFDLEDDLPVPIRDVFLTWHAHPWLNVRFGQQKVPFDRQRVNSSSKLQLVDRSLAARELNLDRDIGVQVFASDLLDVGWLSYQMGVFAGDGRNRVNTDLGGLAMARLQVTPFGTFDDLVEGDRDRTPTPKLALAASVGYNRESRRVASTIETVRDDVRFDFLHATTDLAFKWAGVSVSSAVLYRQGTRANVGREPALNRPRACNPMAIDAAGRACPRSGLGGYVQAGVFVIGDLELAGRAGYLETWDGLAPAFASGRDETWTAELGGGASWYLLGHDLKLQMDGYALPSSDGFGSLFRAQVQVYF